MTQLTATYVGLDVSKRFVQVAVLHPTDGLVEWSSKFEPRRVARLIGRVRKHAVGDIHAAYEAGPIGYGLQRELCAAGVLCQVVAPSLIPKKAGERIKTDRRDARKLAELLRAGLLTEVAPPTPEDEGARDLCRAREHARKDLERSRHRLSKFLLRHDQIYPGKSAWTQRHRVWLQAVRLSEPLAQQTFELYQRAVEANEERLRDVTTQVETLAKREPYAMAAGYLSCFKGISTVTAVTVIAELYGFLRFESPRGLMAYLGLVPSEHSSGGPDQAKRGGITKTGNRHVRRLLVEAAWHYRTKPRVGVALRSRRRGQPTWVITMADKASTRLHRRYWHLVQGGKLPVKAATAVTRELVGFLWAVLHEHARATAVPDPRLKPAA